MDADTLEKAKQQWQSAADLMPQLICLLNGQGQLIHTNRTIERWGLGSVAEVKGRRLHTLLHPNCADPRCYFNPLWSNAAAKIACAERFECEAFDPLLQRHLSFLVQPLIRPRMQKMDDLHAVVMVGDISDIKQAEAGYQRLYEELECVACMERQRRVLSEGMQARLLAILEKTPDYVAMTDSDGGLIYLNPAGRGLLGLGPDDDVSQMRMAQCHASAQEVEEIIRAEALPAAMRSGLWQGKSTLRASDGREIHASQVIIAHHGKDGRVEHFSTVLRDTTEQIRTEQALRDSRDELRRLSGLLVSIQENERRRIALDLHDGLGQSLSLIKLSIEQVASQLAQGAPGEASESLQQLLPRVKEAIGEVRRLSSDLRPSILDDLGVLPTLSWFFREFEAACGKKIVVEKAFNIAEDDVPEPLQITLYRIVQEATNNIAKHAGADRMRVSLERAGDVLRLVIEDNGRGFDPDAFRHADGKCGGLGLISMRERASFSGGTCRIDSAPGKGTRIEVSWPCDPARDAGSEARACL